VGVTHDLFRLVQTGRSFVVVPSSVRLLHDWYSGECPWRYHNLVDWMGSSFLDLNRPWERLENIRECGKGDAKEVYLIVLLKLGELLELA
jgi:hypothetical protein